MRVWRDTLDLALALADAARNGADQATRGLGVAARMLSEFGFTSVLETGLFLILPVVLPDSRRFVVQLVQPNDCDFDLAVFDASGKPLAADASTNNPSAVVLQGPGLCFVAVVSHRGGGEFNLTLVPLQ